MEKPAITQSGKTVRRNFALADGLDEYTGECTTTEVVHLLKRTHFGVKVDDNSHQSTIFCQSIFNS
jgi:hypothetical protein